ncbi:MAG: UvrY/SirA/GacA family response regulator transcription factor [Gammaproteobacteria bacterium]
MIDVLLVDDHDLVRMGIRRLLDDADDINVVAEACSGEEAISLARKLKPDVVLMDVSMPGIGGLEATRKVMQSTPKTKVIAVTMHRDEVFPTRLLDAGAMGYLTKGSKVDEIVHAIREVVGGRRYICAEIAQTLALSLLPGGGGSPFDVLSQREMQVMLMLMQGHKISVISEKLHLSPKTVSTYRYRLFEKLGVQSDVELTRLAVRHGVIEGSQDSAS